MPGMQIQQRRVVRVSYTAIVTAVLLGLANVAGVASLVLVANTDGVRLPAGLGLVAVVLALSAVALSILSMKE